MQNSKIHIIWIMCFRYTDFSYNMYWIPPYQDQVVWQVGIVWTFITQSITTTTTINWTTKTKPLPWQANVPSVKFRSSTIVALAGTCHLAWKSVVPLHSIMEWNGNKYHKTNRSHVGRHWPPPKWAQCCSSNVRHHQQQVKHTTSCYRLRRSITKNMLKMCVT